MPPAAAGLTDGAVRQEPYSQRRRYDGCTRRESKMPDVVRCKRVFGFHAHGIAWLAAHGNLLLALRHPQNIGASRELMLELVERLGQALVEWGVPCCKLLTVYRANIPLPA